MVKTEQARPAWILVLMTTLLLGACGGGGGDNSTPSFKPPEIPDSDGGSSDPDDTPDEEPPVDDPDEEPPAGPGDEEPDPGASGAGPRATISPLADSSMTVDPSKIRLVFQVEDADGDPVAGLERDNFRLRVDGRDISNDPESFMEVTPVTDLRPEIPTVFVLDVSSSISNTDYARAVASLRSLLLDEAGESRLREGQSAAIVIFDGSVQTFMPMTRSGFIMDFYLDQLAALNRPARPDNSSTNLYRAARTSLLFWDDSLRPANVTQGYAVIIGDGADTAGEYTLKETVEHIQDRGKRVFTLPVGDIQETGIQQLNALASDLTLAGERTDFEALEARLTGVNNEIEATLGSIYVLDFVTSARFNEHDLELVYATGEGQPAMTASFDAAGFSSTPREIWINDSPLTSQGLLSRDVNIPLDSTVELTAETRWTTTPGQYDWRLMSSSLVATLGADTESPTLRVTGNRAGTTSIRVTDTANVVGAGSSSPLRQEFSVYVSEMEVTASSYSISPGQDVEMRVNSTAGNGPYSWSLVPDNGRCALNDVAGEVVELTATDMASDYYVCGVTVSDSVGGLYHLKVEVGLPGELLEDVSGSAVDPDFDFEAGLSEETRFEPWTVTAASGLEGLAESELTGSNVLVADSIGNGETTSFEFTSSETTRISFDYAINTEAGADDFEFLIDGQVVLEQNGFLGWQHFDSGALSDGPHTFTWRYVKDSGSTPAAPLPAEEAVAVDNIDFE